MAVETSRTFDLVHGAVVSNVTDSFGTLSVHTLYVTGPNAITDVAEAVAALLVSVEAQAQALRAAMVAAGWTP